MRWGWGRGEQSDVEEREERLAHIRIEADRLVDEGLSEDEAMRQARARFGYDPTLDAADVRARMNPLEFLLRDVRQARRRLAATPGSTATILLSLVVGIGVNTAIFSLADQTLMRPLPIEDPDRVVQLSWEGQWVGEGRGWGSVLPHPLFLGVRQQGEELFSAIAARSPGVATLITPAGPERGNLSLVTGDFFTTMGIRPHLGRLIDASDDLILDGHAVAVLSHSFWTTRYASDPDVVGQELVINQRPFTIVGVAPEGFHGTDWSVVPVAWTSMMMNDHIHPWGDLDQPRVRFQHVYARLAPGVSRRDAEEALQPWFGRYLQTDMEHPSWPGGREDSEIAAYLQSRLALLEGGSGQAARSYELTEPVLILSFATLLLLLLACLNVANLSLARAVTRYRDTAVRTALGASRGRIMMEHFVESGLLALGGGAVGVLIAPGVGQWILAYLEVGGAGMAIDATLDGRTLAGALLIAVVATVLSGMGPAWFAASTHPMGALRTRSAAGGVRLRRALVVGQVALALVLLMSAGLFASTLATLRAGGPGFATGQLITFAVHPGNDGYEAVEAKQRLEDILEVTRGVPGIESAGMTLWPMLTGGGWGNSMFVEARDGRFETDLYLPMNAVTPGYFDLLGIRIVRGRDFDESDRTSGDEWAWDKAIVSQSFVDRYLPDEEPLGVRIDFTREDRTSLRMEIIGVVEDFAEQRLRDPDPQIYFPMLAQVRPGATYYARSRLPLAQVAPDIRSRVEELDPVLTVSEMRTFDEQIDRLLVFERLLSSIGAAFALFATALAMIGIYGVLAFSVQARTKEVGIRMALGAPRVAASRLIVTDAFRLTVLGVLVALPTIWLLGSLIESWLYGVHPMQPWAILLSTGVVLLVCLLASALPAWRMARTDPTEAFRVE